MTISTYLIFGFKTNEISLWAGLFLHHAKQNLIADNKTQNQKRSLAALLSVCLGSSVNFMSLTGCYLHADLLEKATSMSCTFPGI